MWRRNVRLLCRLLRCLRNYDSRLRGPRHMPMISYSLIQASLYSLYEILAHGLIVLKKIQFFVKKPCKYELYHIY